MNPQAFRNSRTASWAVAGLIALLVVLIYWPSLALPVSFDDAWGMRLVRDFTWLDLFTRTQNFGYYRPLYLLYYKIGALFGAQGALAQHIAGISFHIANALLLIRLTRSALGDGQRAIAFAAGVLFAINPFAVQTVALPAGLNHLSALLFMQLALLQYVALQRSAAHRARHITLFSAFALLALLSNEVALSIAGFCLSLEVVAAMQARAWTRQSWRFVWVAGLCAGYALLYLLIPKGDAPEFQFTLADTAQRALFALQALAYPLAFLMHAVAGNAFAPELQVVIAAAIVLGLCAWVAAKHNSRVALALGLLMFASGAALPVLRLATSYIENAPRVFYVASTGIAIVLAALVTAPGVINVLLGASIALASFFHARDQLRLLDMVHEPVRALVAAAQAAPPAAHILMLNPPEWAAYASKQFPLGREGAIVLAPYVRGDDLTIANAGISRTVALARLEQPFQPTPLLYGAFGEPLGGDALAQAIQRAGVVLQTTNSGEQLITRWIGGVSAPSTSAPMAIFADGLQVRDIVTVACRDGYSIESRWRKAGAESIAPTLSMFAQALDANGNKLGQADGGPVGGLLGFVQLHTAADVIDRRLIALPPDAAAQNATLLLGVYDYTGGQRLPATDAAGQRLAGNALSLTLPAPSSQPCP